jgi:uncharacterized protein YybS (DUF2232 family)
MNRNPLGSAPEEVPLRRVWTPGPALAGMLSLLVFGSLLAIPFLGIFTAMLAPLPLLHLAATGRPSLLAWGWVAVVLAGGALLTQSVWLVAVLAGYLAVAVWPVVAVELWARAGWPGGRWLAVVSGAALVLALGVNVAVAFPTHPAEALRSAMETATRGTETLVRLLTPHGRVAPQAMTEALQATAYLLPSVAALYVLAVALWLRPRLPALHFPVGHEPFHLMRAEEWLPVPFALGGLGWVFARGLVKWCAANLLVLVLGLYFLAGLAIIHFYLGRRLGSNRWVRLAVVLFAVQLPLAVAVAAAGLIDGFFPLRRGAGWDGGSEE